MQFLSYLICWLLLFTLIQSEFNSTSTVPANFTKQISYLYKKLQNHYWQRNQSFQLAVKWQHLKGLYQSRIHFNILDHKNTNFVEWIRIKYFKIDDINMFVTSFVLYGLLEAEQLGTISIDQHLFSQSLEAISNFRDKNSPYGIPQYVFWPQQLVNGTWTARSANLFNIINLIPNFPKFMDPILNKLGLGILTNIKQISKYFCIPPDNDDSSVNLALLGFMKEINNSHYNFWNSLNFRKQDYYQKALKYAYRPFELNNSENNRSNEIDPRTYFVLHDFIQLKKQQAEQKGQEAQLILPTTWLLNVDEEIKQLVVMPFQTNNVDATVCANFLFGLVYQIISKEINITDQLEKMMQDTSDLLVYVVSHLINQRPDLVLMYYPSRYDFYWFIARTCSLLRRHPDVSQPLDQIYIKLNTMMRTIGTNNTIQQAKDHKQGIYWAQFIGNYAGKNRNDDALFSSALALNALLDTWTTRQGKYISYDQYTPKYVREAITNGIKYLNSSIGSKMKQSNAFFSGSMKIFKQSSPYFYPANIHLNDKGQNIDPQETTLKDLSFGLHYYVKGIFQPEQYNKMLEKKWFGSPVPINFTNFNDGYGLTFPYWSSQPITEIMMITAMSKFQGAEQSYQSLKLKNK